MQNPTPAEVSPSLGNTWNKVIIFPNVALEILDAIHRRNILSKDDTAVGVVVALLGVPREERDIEITDCFVNSWTYLKSRINSQPTVSINREKYEKLLALKKRQYKKEDVVGWAFSSPISMNTTELHMEWTSQRHSKSYQSEYFCPLHIQFNVKEDSSVEIEAHSRLHNGTFISTPCEIKTKDSTTAALLGHYVSHMFSQSQSVPLKVSMESTLSHLNELQKLCGEAEALYKFPDLTVEDVEGFRTKKLSDSTIAAHLGRLATMDGERHNVTKEVSQ